MTPGEIRRSEGEGPVLSDAHAIRREVFVDEQGVSEELEMDDEDGDATHVVAYDSTGTPVGTGRLREVEPGVGKVERVAVRRDRRRSGVGEAVMAALHEVARERDLERLVCHAQVRVEEFYRGLGYETVGDEFPEAGIPHVEMERGLE